LFVFVVRRLKFFACVSVTDHHHLPSLDCIPSTFSDINTWHGDSRKGLTRLSVSQAFDSADQPWQTIITRDLGLLYTTSSRLRTMFTQDSPGPRPNYYPYPPAHHTTITHPHRPEGTTHGQRRLLWLPRRAPLLPTTTSSLSTYPYDRPSSVLTPLGQVILSVIPLPISQRSGFYPFLAAAAYIPVTQTTIQSSLLRTAGANPSTNCGRTPSPLKPKPPHLPLLRPLHPHPFLLHYQPPPPPTRTWAQYQP